MMSSVDGLFIFNVNDDGDGIPGTTRRHQFLDLEIPDDI